MPTTDLKPKRCSDFPDAPSCCDSCHDDYDMGYDNMIELYEDPTDPNRVTAIICCRIANSLDESEG